MAIGRGTKRKSQDDNDGYLSDESSFYGDEATKQELEVRANDFNATDWWEHKEPSLMEIAQTNVSTAVASKSAVLYNPYEERFSARQLGESVEEFLQRLPPASSQASKKIPWIFIANPYRKAPSLSKIKSEFGADIKEEGPQDEMSDWAQFVVLGGKLLQELTGIRHEIENSNPGKAKQTITKALNPRKDEIAKKLLDTAVELHCTTGKGSFLALNWMLFCEPEEVNAVWAVIAHGTANNELGIAAKVAPDDGDDRKQRLICVYTKDFTDMKDLLRIVTKLKDYGLVESRGKPIYYKCDAYTYLHLNSGNEYNIKVSLYSSTEVLQAKPQIGKDGKVEGFFYKK